MKLVHWEIPSTDLDASEQFYAQLFGWRMQRFNDEYVMFQVEEGIGGGLSRVEAVPGPCIQVYIGVEDIPATLAKAKALGGSVVHEKTAIGGDMGHWADFDDPCGCRIGIWSQA